LAVAATAEDRTERSDHPGLAALRDLVAEDLRSVNAAILDNMHSTVPLIPQLAGHIIAAGGKRLRPMLTLASAKLCDYRGTAQIGLAAAVEFIHTATLLHDDVVDESELRRGRPTANAVWSNQASVLVGDFLFSRAFQLMVATGSIEVLRILSNAAATIAEGEVLQLTTANDPESSEESYLEVVRGKTAALFAAATRVGAVVADRPAAEAEALDQYGLHLGTAFQLIDDVLDYSAREATLGKTVGDDFREGKVTLPIILAFRRGTAEERQFWRRTIAELDQQDGDLQHAMVLMDRHGTLAETVGRARLHADRARDALSVFPACRERQILIDIADFCVDRAY
jgi:octaprenyl-diphosphate synthase